MTNYGSLEEVLLLPIRKLVVASTDIDLRKSEDCIVFILLVEESFGSAGGRAGGSGSRKIGRILGFKRLQSKMDMLIDSREMEIIDRFDVPDRLQEILAFALHYGLLRRALERCRQVRGYELVADGRAEHSLPSSRRGSASRSARVTCTNLTFLAVDHRRRSDVRRYSLTQGIRRIVSPI